MKYHAVLIGKGGWIWDQRMMGKLNDDVNPNLLNNGRRLTSDKNQENVKTLFQAGKLENVINGSGAHENLYFGNL